MDSVSPGKLKVYLGMAAGVGKTYAMLSDGQDARRKGVDVVIGFIESYGRAETESLLHGLEILSPIQQTSYQAEFDLDACLARNPRLVLLDELAHPNAPGSRNLKRWQDIEELLAAGIDVYTTVNIQHLESAKDVVAQVTGVVVSETVPDKLFSGNCEIELIDLPPEELRDRIREGKVYVPEMIEQAIQGFFRKSNLLALRELALRHTADRVDDELLRARTDAQVSNAWHVGEKILVCVAPNLMAQRVVRAGKRLATSLHADLIAVSVDSLRAGGDSAYSEIQVVEALQLAEHLGAKVERLAGHDIVAELLSFARNENVTTIIMGKPVRPRWKEFLFGSVVDETIRSSGDIDVFVITGEEDPKPILRSRRKSGWWGLLDVLLWVGGATAVGFMMFHRFGEANIAMVYLLATVVVSVKRGRMEALFAALLSVLIFDFCFVPPRLSFALENPGYLVTFGMMLGVSILLSTLTARLKAQTKSATRREKTTAELFDLSHRLAASRKREEMARMAADKIHSLFGIPASVIVPTDGKLAPIVESATKFERVSSELAVSTWVFDHSRSAGKSTETLSTARGLHIPLAGSSGMVGVLAVDMMDQSVLDPTQRSLLDAIGNQLAGALERAKFAKQSHDSSLRVETERLRSDLLSAVSHDLRTPLASISGSAGSLLVQPELSDLSRELAQTIGEETDRMSRLVRNLLDMTRVQGAVQLTLDWYGVDELIATALDRTQKEFSKPVRVSTESAIVRVDGALIEQVFVNLLENAAHHAGPDATVKVSVKALSNEVYIDFVDDGPGITSGEEKKIFDRFQRHGGAGFGLGLAICKAAVEAHGGTITAMNHEPRGATLRVVLPLSEVERE